MEFGARALRIHGVRHAGLAVAHGGERGDEVVVGTTVAGFRRAPERAAAFDDLGLEIVERRRAVRLLADRLPRLGRAVEVQLDEAKVADERPPHEMAGLLFQ